MVIILSFPLIFLWEHYSIGFEALNGGIEILNNFVLTCIIYFLCICIYTYICACISVGVCVCWCVKVNVCALWKPEANAGSLLDYSS